MTLSATGSARMLCNPAIAWVASCLSFALYWLWTFSVLIAGIFAPTHAGSAFEGIWLWSSMFHIASIVVMGLLSRRLGSFLKLLPVVFGILATVVVGATVLLYVALSLPGEAGFPALLFGSLLIGVGTGGWLVLWCESFVAIPQPEKVISLVAVGILTSILLFAALWAASALLARVIVFILPFVSIALSLFSFKRSGAALPEKDKVDAQLSPRPILFCLIYSIPLGFFPLSLNADSTTTANSSLPAGLGSIAHPDILGLGWPGIVLPSFALIALLLAFDRLLLRRFKSVNLLHIVISISVGGLLLFAMFGSEASVFSGILVYTSEQLVVIVFYSQFASIARSGKTSPARAYAFCVCGTDLGFIVGMLIGEMSLNLLPGHFTQVTMAIVYALALLGLVLIPRLLDRREDGVGGVCGAQILAQQVDNRKTPFACTSSDSPVGADGLLAQERALDGFARQHNMSAREKEMLTLILRGKSVPQIAAESYLSKNTVKTHMAHIYTKLAIHSRDELIGAFEEYERGAGSAG